MEFLTALNLLPRVTLVDEDDVVVADPLEGAVERNEEDPPPPTPCSSASDRSVEVDVDVVPLLKKEDWVLEEKKDEFVEAVKPDLELSLFLLLLLAAPALPDENGGGGGGGGGHAALTKEDDA